MSKGQSFPSERLALPRVAGECPVTQWTAHESIHHHPFFYIPATSGDGQYVFIASHRSGRPEFYKISRMTGEIIQLTDRPDINEWSFHPAWNGRFLLYMAGLMGYRLDTETLEETVVADFTFASSSRASGMVGGGMGVTSLSACDRYWAVRLNKGDKACLTISDLEKKHSNIILEREEIGHLSFCPDDNNLLFVAGPPHDRVWVINRDGSGLKRLYNRRPPEWITHESWIPGTKELAFVDWPHAVRAVHAETGVIRTVTSFNAWHPVCNRQGSRMVTDTHFPDTGLHIFDPRPEHDSTPRFACLSHSSNAGSHWGQAFPYENGPVSVYAPQHTHPHPTFLPDGRSILFTSDRTGHAQIYEADLAEHFDRTKST